MTFYNGLPGVHRPVPRITQDSGATVLIRVAAGGVFDPTQTLEWAVLDGPAKGAYRVGLVDSPALAQTLQSATLEQARYVLGVVTHLGAVIPLNGDGDVPEDIATTAGQAIAALGWS